MTKLTDKKIQWIIRQKMDEKKTNKQIAVAMKITQRSVQQLYQKYTTTGIIPQLNPDRRPRTHITEEPRQIIEQAYHKAYLGARLLRHHMQRC